MAPPLEARGDSLLVIALSEGPVHFAGPGMAEHIRTQRSQFAKNNEPNNSLILIYWCVSLKAFTRGLISNN